MATTRIMPLHIGKGRTESQAVSDIIDYVANPQKTDNGKLITGYGCDSRTADAEFLLAKRQYDYSGRSAHALKRVQRTGIAVQQSSAAVQPRPLGMG